MNDFYRTLLDTQLDSQCRRVQLKPLKNPASWVAVPEEARPRRQQSCQAVFAHCLWRRKGYLIDTTANDFLALVGKYVDVETIFCYLDEKSRSSFEERFQRGLLWKPFALPIVDLGDSVQVGEAKPGDLAAAAYLAEKGCKNVKVQAFHSDKEPANARCLSYMQEHGLIPYSGGDPIPLTKVAVSL